ncbi:ras GEF [Punctularia strigosozonata HHB-11173 SS5]|uniref:ras GEF n=1 Tax=Punctularia strigosozonata (strain HHB-11173) TaxID=741275 RepID=UPI0004417D24|nr:ras GEF [Punctularia strigosozonata HHB-11173 SS5]EIN12418.1 ras GEF [Punctularia strigosozonata HHB-11173 SS5]
MSPMPDSAASASSSSLHLAAASTSTCATISTATTAPSHSFSSGATYDTRATSPDTDEASACTQTASGGNDFVLAMHDFAPQHQSATCLAFRAGQVIHVLNRDPSGWWDGELDGRRGWFPSNYVSSEVGSIMEEQSPVKSRTRPGHAHSQSVASVASVASWASTPSPMHHTFSRPSSSHRPSKSHPHISTPSPSHSRSRSASPDTSAPAYPPLMHPLLHALSLLQTAVASHRPAHFQPSTAYVVSAVRAALDAADCLPREAPHLARHPALAAARKALLGDLAALVAQAKKASAVADEHTAADGLGEKEGGEGRKEVTRMLRLGGQVFAHVRRFLAIAAQCGVELSTPPQQQQQRSSNGSAYDAIAPHRAVTNENEPPGADAPRAEDDGEDATATVGRAPLRTTNGIVQKIQMRRMTRERSLPGSVPGTPGAALRARSLGDLKAARATAADAPPLPVTRQYGMQQQQRQQQHRIPSAPLFTRHRHDRSFSSLSSASSASSFSSASSTASGSAPSTPPSHFRFPAGENGSVSVSAAELHDALRHTHDAYLSTIAAFVGHAHSHSRASHASSTGHMFELAREIVESVCRLLGIVDAVMRHPALADAAATAHNPRRFSKAEYAGNNAQGYVLGLARAKDALYAVTAAFAESVRTLGRELPEGVSEEDERAALLRAATGALKAGAECVAAVRMCVGRSGVAGPFVVYVGPGPPEAKVGEEEVPEERETEEQEPDRTERVGRPAGVLRALYKAQGVEDDEDLTIQAQTPSPSSFVVPARGGVLPTPPPRPAFALPSHVEREVPLISPAVEDKPLPPLMEPDADVEPPEPSPRSPVLSVTRTEDDRTTWEGSQRHHEREAAAAALEDKLVRGDLPSIPPDADPTTWILSHDHAMEDVAYNTEGLLVGATLPALVEKMTPHDSLVDTTFASVFFLTFRAFATPTELVRALIARYNVAPPRGLAPEDLYVWQQRKGVPVRLRVSNFVKAWLEVHWRPASDNAVIPALADFTQNALRAMFPGPSQRIMDLLALRSQADGGAAAASPKGTRRDAGMPISPPSVPPTEVPRPVMTKTLLASLRARNFANIAVTDFDPLELARQMTIMECELFCGIVPDDLLEIGQEGAKSPANVRSVTQLSTVITGWVTESILNEPDTKKRATLVKFFIKVADRCTTLNNFSTSRSVLAALDSSTISRLHQTWNAIPQKYKVQLEAMRKLADHSRNYREYRTRLRNTPPPAVPFLGLYLTDITFCREGNPSHRASPLAPDRKLINFNKYHKLARIVQDMQRFQVPYTLKGIPEVQDFLQFAFRSSRSSTGDIQDLYRRSLLVEPRQPADAPPTSDVRQIFPWGNRSQPTTSVP